MGRCELTCESANLTPYRLSYQESLSYIKVRLQVGLLTSMTRILHLVTIAAIASVHMCTNSASADEPTDQMATTGDAVGSSSPFDDAVKSSTRSTSTLDDAVKSSTSDSTVDADSSVLFNISVIDYVNATANVTTDWPPIELIHEEYRQIAARLTKKCVRPEMKNTLSQMVRFHSRIATIVLANERFQITKVYNESKFLPCMVMDNPEGKGTCESFNERFIGVMYVGNDSDYPPSSEETSAQCTLPTYHEFFKRIGENASEANFTIIISDEEMAEHFKLLEIMTGKRKIEFEDTKLTPHQLYNSTYQMKKLYTHVSSFELAIVLLVWSSLCWMIVFKSLHLTSAVVLDMQLEEES
ncbi:hypothetical protein Aduo_010764 [Ancylostoma duodenale]